MLDQQSPGEAPLQAPVDTPPPALKVAAPAQVTAEEEEVARPVVKRAEPVIERAEPVIKRAEPVRVARPAKVRAAAVRKDDKEDDKPEPAPRHRKAAAVMAARAAEPARAPAPAPKPVRNDMEETLRQCRAAGYHTTQCIERGCQATKYGLACRG
jgi:hypothetical protein